MKSLHQYLRRCGGHGDRTRNTRQWSRRQADSRSQPCDWLYVGL